MAFQAIVENNVTTGYTFQVEDGDLTNIFTYDANYELVGESIKDVNAGIEFSTLVVEKTLASDDPLVTATDTEFTNAGITAPLANDKIKTESGSQVDGDFSRTFEFNYNLAGDFLSGTETINGQTTTYGADMSIVGVTTALTNVPTLSSTERESMPPAIMAALAQSSDPVYKILDEDGAFPRTTYYKADSNGNGVIIGYAETFSSGEVGGETTTVYSDSNYAFVGDAWSGGGSTGYHFVTTAANGTFVEKGSDTTGDVVTEYELNFAANGDLTSGTETSNGRTVTYAADWVVTDISVSTSGLTPLTDIELAEIPTALHSPGGTDTFKTTYSDNEFTEITFLSNAGDILGFANSWNDEWGTSIQYHDADYNWLGGSWSDSLNNSGSYFSSDLAVANIVTSDDGTTNILTSVTDTALLAVINDSSNFPSTPTMLKVETGSNSWSYDETNIDGYDHLHY